MSPTTVYAGLASAIALLLLGWETESTAVGIAGMTVAIDIAGLYLALPRLAAT